LNTVRKRKKPDEEEEDELLMSKDDAHKAAVKSMFICLSTPIVVLLAEYLGK
jgi:hypothetical protein